MNIVVVRLPKHPHCQCGSVGSRKLVQDNCWDTWYMTWDLYDMGFHMQLCLQTVWKTHIKLTSAHDP